MQIHNKQYNKSEIHIHTNQIIKKEGLGPYDYEFSTV